MDSNVIELLEISPVIAAVRDDLFVNALASPVKIVFLLGANVLTIRDRIAKAHQANKFIFIHLDLCEGIGKDKYAIEFLAQCGADGIISTKSSIIKMAKERNLATVQRFFAFDSQGVESIKDTLKNSKPDVIEIMPGIIGKVIDRFSACGVPLIAGGLIETKQEVTNALGQGAFAVSTGKEKLWYI